MKDIKETEFYKDAMLKRGKNLETIDRYVNELGVSQRDLIVLLADMMAFADELEEENKKLLALVNAHQNNITLLSEESARASHDVRVNMLKLYTGKEKSIAEDLLKCLAVQMSAKGKTGAKNKLAHDPKQRDKAFVRGCWDDWKKKPENYSSQAEFSRDMLRKCENLKSQPSIEAWCRAWKKELTKRAQ